MQEHPLGFESKNFSPRSEVDAVKHFPDRICIQCLGHVRFLQRTVYCDFESAARPGFDTRRERRAEHEVF
jgi:hypothetical protein